MTAEQYMKKLPHWKRPSPKNKYRHNEWKVACIVFGYRWAGMNVGESPVPEVVPDHIRARTLSRQPRPYDDTLVGYWLQACDVTDMNYTGCRSGDKAKKNVNTWVSK